MDRLQDDYAFFQELIDTVPGESELVVENRTQTLSRTELQARLDAKISEAKEKAAKNAPIIPEKSEKPLRPSKPSEKPSKTSEKPSKLIEKPSKPTEKPSKPTEKPLRPTEKPLKPLKPSKKSPKPKSNKPQSI